MASARIETRRFERLGIAVSATSAADRISPLDKGARDGLTVKMFFAIFLKGQGNQLETGMIEYVQQERSRLAYSGQHLNGHTRPQDDLILQLVDPLGLKGAEKQLGDLLSLAEGLDDE